MNTTPLLKDLQQYITPHYAADWEVIGTQLNLPIGGLKAIKAENPTDFKRCCNEIWIQWLREDPTPSWEKLLNVIGPPAVSGSAPHKGD